jgi:tetratricopeptide (TPR) repeat protein
MDKQLEERLKGLEEQLKRFVDVLEQGLGRDLARPIKAVRDGYYEAALTNAGSIIEAMLRDIWQREGIKGEGKKKTIEQLFSVVKEQAQMDRLVQDYIRDIQLVRNRAAHGEDIVAEDCLEALRKLSVILGWYFDRYVLGGESAAPATPEQGDEERSKRRMPWSRIALLALLALVVFGAVLLKVGQLRREALRKAQAEYRMVIAPFDAATAAARDEAETMRQLLYASLAEVLEEERGVRVMTPDADAPPRTDGEARTFGENHLADVTIWGRVISVAGETVIEPHIASAESDEESFGGDDSATDPAGKELDALRAGQAAENQFAMRQAKADEIRNLAVILAATQADIPDDRALAMLRPIETADSLFHQGALIWNRDWGHPEGAALFERALSMDPGLTPARVRLAREAYWDHRYSDAADHCDQMLSTSPETSYSLLICSRTYEELARFDDAESIWQRAVLDSTAPTPYAVFSYARFLLRHYDPERAVEMLRTFIARSSGTASATAVTARLSLAEIYGWIGREQEARQVLAETPVEYPIDEYYFGHDHFRLLLSHALDDRAEELLDVIDQYRDRPIRRIGPRVDLARARQDYEAAHRAVEAALTDYHWAYGKRRWLTWTAWKEPLAAAMGFAVAAGLTTEDDWARRDFNPGIADQWHAAIDLFEGHIDRTKAFLDARDEGDLDHSIWGWRGQPKALAAYLAGEPEQAWERIQKSGDLASRPALTLLALAGTGEPQATEDAFEALRASLINTPDWMSRGASDRYIRGELTEAAIESYTPFNERGFWFLEKPDWDLETFLDLGAYFLATGEDEKARDYLQRAVDTNLRHEIDWLLAKHALENLETR